MYIEYETAYDLGQSLYKLNNNNQIDEYKITKVEHTHTFSSASLEGTAATRYLIAGVTDSSYCTTWFSQNDVTKKFRTSKKKIAQEIINQL